MSYISDNRGNPMHKSRRFTAWLVDFALVLAAAVLLAVLTFHRITALVTDVPELAARSGWDILTSHGDVLDASGDLGVGLWDDMISAVVQAFVLLVLLTFLYQWATLAFTGRTVGKAVLGLRIDRRSAGRAARRATVTTVADVALYAVACILVLEGEFALSVVVWAAAVVMFFLNALPVLLPAHRSLADRFSGTTVTNVTLPDIPSMPPVPPLPQRFRRGSA